MPLSAANISFPAGMVIAIAAAVWQAPNYFVTAEAAAKSHEEIIQDIREIYLELKIDSANTELVYMESVGITSDQQRRHYALLEFSVQDMTKKLMDSR